MSSRLSSDTLLLGAVLLLTLGIAIVAVHSGRTQQNEDQFPAARTTFSAAPGGYQALYVTMESLGYPVGRWRSSLETLQQPSTLIVAAPESPITPEERSRLLRWVSQGSLLIYLTELGEAIGEPASLEDLMESNSKVSRPVQPTPLAAVAPNLHTRAAVHLDPSEPRADEIPRRPERRARGQIADTSPLLSPASLVPLYRDEEGTTCAFTRWGRGAIVLSSSPWSLSTAGVAQGDNFAWLLAAIEAYGPRSGVGVLRRWGVKGGSHPTSQHPNTSTPQRLDPVYFDEYHHGYGVQRGVLSLLAPIARLGLAQVVVAWLLLLSTISRRFGGMVPDEGRVRRSRSEYLGSMTSLLGRAHAVDLAVAQVKRQFMSDTTRALGLPLDASELALLDLVAARGVDPERLRSLLNDADRLIREKDRTHQEDALRIARELSRVRTELIGAYHRDTETRRNTKVSAE